MTGSGEQVLFWVLAPLAVIGALGLIFAKKAVHAALEQSRRFACHVAVDADRRGDAQPALLIERWFVERGPECALPCLNTDQDPFVVHHRRHLAPAVMQPFEGQLGIGVRWPSQPRECTRSMISVPRMSHFFIIVSLA